MKKMLKPDNPRRKKAQITLPELTAQIAELVDAIIQGKSAGEKLNPIKAPSPPPLVPCDPTHKCLVERAFAPIARKFLDASSKQSGLKLKDGSRSPKTRSRQGGSTPREKIC